MKKAIAMRCSKNKFELIKQKIIESGLKIEQIRDFKTSNYLVNNFAGEENIITNVLYSDAKNHNREIHETFNAKIFLDACGIETDPKFEITKEQINLLLEHGGDNTRLQLRNMFPEVFKKELVVGKWYKNNFDSLFCLTKITNNKHIGYGFLEHGKYCKNANWGVYGFKEATSQEVETALVREWEKLGGVGLDLYIELDGKEYQLEKEVGKFQLIGKILFYQGAPVMSDGIWATIIPSKKMTLSEIEIALGHKVEIV